MASGAAASAWSTAPAPPSRSCPSCSTATPPSPARAWWPRPSTCPSSPATAPAAPSTWSSTTSSGFTTAPEAARSSVYPTDVAKMVQAPIFHVNGDDPEACARAARLAFGFRQAFHKDVVIDMVCYRRHGHNEGDDPSYTQPLMYGLIDAKRSVRKLYTEALVRRGDISLEEAEQALDDFSARLQAALDETRAEAEGRAGRPAHPARVRPARPDHPPGARPASTPRRCPAWPPWCGRCPRASCSTRSWPASSSSATRWWPTARSTGRWARRWPSARCCSRGPTSGSPARTPGGAPSRTATPSWSTTRRAPSTCPSRDSRAVASPSATRCCRSTRAWASSTATRSRPRTTWWPGRPSSATSGTAPRSSSTTSWWPPRTSGARSPASCCCCRTATRGRAPSTPRPASSGS